MQWQYDIKSRVDMDKGLGETRSGHHERLIIDSDNKYRDYRDESTIVSCHMSTCH